MKGLNFTVMEGLNLTVVEGLNLTIMEGLNLTVMEGLKKEDVTTKPLGHCPVLGIATELELYIKLIESKLFDLTRRNVIEMAFTLA